MRFVRPLFFGVDTDLSSKKGMYYGHDNRNEGNCQGYKVRQSEEGSRGEELPPEHHKETGRRKDGSIRGRPDTARNQARKAFPCRNGRPEGHVPAILGKAL